MDAFKIDSEFQSLIPPLTDDEFQRLERSIQAEGVREPIITWNGTIIDGHNRFKICSKHGIVCPNREREFDSRDAAKIWICENQLGRRNLEPGQKAALGIDQNEAEIREAARLRKGGRPPKKPGVHGPQVLKQPEQQKGRTHEIIAKQVGVSEATVKRVMGVKRKDPELYEKVRRGEVSAREAYRKVTDEKKPQKRKQPQLTDDGRRICSHCGNPINDGEAYAFNPSMHKRCRDERQNNTRYKNPDISLIENVAVYNIESLLNELTASANGLRDSWAQSIEVNESMGAKLSVVDKNRLENAANNLIETIEVIRKETA